MFRLAVPEPLLLVLRIIVQGTTSVASRASSYVFQVGLFILIFANSAEFRPRLLIQ
jgi:hypothetical protein